MLLKTNFISVPIGFPREIHVQHMVDSVLGGNAAPARHVPADTHSCDSCRVEQWVQHVGVQAHAPELIEISIFFAETMAPRVGFEPTTNRLTAGCSTTELPRISSAPSGEEAGLYQVRRRGERPALRRSTRSKRKRGSLSGPQTQIKRGPLSGPSKALGMVGCLQGKTA